MRWLRKERGFTYIEVMAAVIVLMLMIPMFVFFVEGVKMVGSSKTRNQATEYAKEKLEELKDIDWEKLPSSEQQDNPGSFTRTWKVTPIGGMDEDYIKKLEVTVSWDDGKQKVTLATYRHKNM